MTAHYVDKPIYRWWFSTRFPFARRVLVANSWPFCNMPVTLSSALIPATPPGKGLQDDLPCYLKCQFTGRPIWCCVMPDALPGV